MGLYTNNVLVLRWLLLPCALTAGCSFLATNFDAESAVGREAFTRANYHARFRGPDATTVRHRSGWTFVHNLLAMTGTFTPQPFVAAGATAVFNGEIYNFRELARELEVVKFCSDTSECICSQRLTMSLPPPKTPVLSLLRSCSVFPVFTQMPDPMAGKNQQPYPLIKWQRQIGAIHRSKIPVPC